MSEQRRVEDTVRSEEQTIYEMMFRWREQLGLTAMRVVALLSIPLVIFGVMNASHLNLPALPPFYVLLSMVMLYAAFSRRVSHQWRVGIFLGTLFGVALLNMIYTPIVGDDRFFVFSFIIFAAILLRPSYARFWAILAALVYAAFMAYFHAYPAILDIGRLYTPSYALLHTAVLVVMAAGIVASLEFLFRRLVQAINVARMSMEALQSRQKETEALARRERETAEMMERIVSLSRAMYRMRDMGSFMREIPARIGTAFDLCQVEVFRANQQLDSLRLVGRAQGIISAQEAIFRPLEMTSPEGRAVLLGGEVWEEREGPCPILWAVPLTVRGDVIGVLVFAFREKPPEEVQRALRMLADEVAYAVDSLEMMERLAERMRQLTHLYGQTLLSGGGENETCRFEIGQFPDEQLQRMTEAARRSGEYQVAPLEGEEGGELLVFPLIWRGLYLGSIALVADQWDASRLSAVEEAARRMAMVLENTYLLLDSRRRALLEEALRTLGDKVWANLSLRSVMETSVRELGRLLGAQEVSLYIEPVALEEG